MLKIDVCFTRAAIRAQEPLTVGLVGAKVTFSFDATWKPLGKIAVFRQGDITKDAPVLDGTVTIPWEVLQQPGVPVEIGIYGTDGTGKRVVPTVWVRTNPVRPAAQPVEDPSLDPTPEVWEQVLARLAELGDSGVYVGTEEPKDSRVNVWVDPDGDSGALSVLKVRVGNTWQAIPAIKGDPGYTPVRGKDYFTEEDQKKLVSAIAADSTWVDTVKEAVKAEVPLVKTAQQPTFVSSVEEMTDPTKVYVMPDGYMYGYQKKENYNLLKTNGTGEEKMHFTSKLDNTSSEVIGSNTSNLVTGWFPVTPGKYYAVSAYREDLGTRVTYAPKIVRVQLKLKDTTIKVYTNTAGGNEYPSIALSDYDNGRAAYVRGVDDENAVAMRLHLSDNINEGNISNAALFKAYQPMITEGSTKEEAIDKGLFSEYVDGDAAALSQWYNTGLAYNQPVSYEERVVATEKGVADLQSQVEELKTGMENPASSSPYFRNVNFGVLPTAYYRGQSASYEAAGFTKNTKYSTFMTAWKALVANHGTYVTEKELGAASDGQPIYLYDFKPVGITNRDKPIPKVIIVAGQHGFEKSNVFGLYHFVDNLLNRWAQHPALEYLRHHVELLIVPVLNTYGFDTLQYKNANGVNTNRNYGSRWALEEDPSDSDYGGQAPFDQPETQIIRDLLEMNTRASLVIDFHTCGGTSVTKYEDVNWCGLCPSTDPYYNRMLDAAAHHLSALTAHFNPDYALGQPDVMMGHMTATNGTGLLRHWATDNNFIGVLVEGFNGFPNGPAFAPEVYRANEEILVNYLMTALNYLK